MPKGPRGEKRPADVIGAAVMVMRIATGEIEEPEESAAWSCRRQKGRPCTSGGSFPKEAQSDCKNGGSEALGT